MGTGERSPLREIPTPNSGREMRQTADRTAAEEWQAVPGYEARRFKAAFS